MRPRTPLAIIIHAGWSVASFCMAPLLLLAQRCAQERGTKWNLKELAGWLACCLARRLRLGTISGSDGGGGGGDHFRLCSSLLLLQWQLKLKLLFVVKVRLDQLAPKEQQQQQQ